MTGQAPGERPTVAGRSILIVDDDLMHQRAMRALFDRRGWAVAAAADPWEALELYTREPSDVVLLDQELPRLPGLRFLEVLRERDPDATVIMLTGRGDIPTAVEAMRLGAENFLTKPANPAHLEAAAERAHEKRLLRRRTRFLEARGRERTDDDAALGSSARMREVDAQLRTLAEGSAPVLLTGETGTGKSRAAQLLHARSARAGGPFIEVNCAGLTATFLDSELFGHERGAFTDAKTQKSGLFELAHGGTLFLDEVGDLALDLQPKLLRVLETQRFRRLGGTREIQVDVRLIAATHRDLASRVQEGQFRQDLFYRLAVFPVHLPPLRERERDDVLALLQQALSDVRQRAGRGPARLAPEAVSTLARYPWPGNVRELRNVMERAALLARDADEIRTEHLPLDLRTAAPAAPLSALDDLSLASAERRHIQRVLAHFGNHRTRAAQALGISRATLYNKLAE